MGNEEAGGGVDAADAAVAHGDLVDWQLSTLFTDPVKTCTSTLHYTLIRVP